jgi:hypothetical protein
MANTINNSEMRFDLILETAEGETPATGNRLDLPCTTDQGPLTYTRARVTDDTRRANRETAAPTDGASAVEGSISANMRPCDALDVLIQSAISGRFDASGKATAGENDLSFSMFTTLRTNGSYLGYLDKGLQVSKMAITNAATSDDSVKVSFDVMGLKRQELTTANALPVTAATEKAFNYIDIGNLKIGDQAMEFTDLSFETGTPRGARKVFGKKDAVGMAATANRETTVNVKAFRGDFLINELVRNPVVVVFYMLNDDGGYRVTLNHAKATVPTDELNDTGLLVNIQFTAHAPDNNTPALVIEKL